MRGLGSSFCTLTYNDDNVPYVTADSPFQTLVKRDYDLFMKRLRASVASDGLPPFKFLSCGEYGNLGRPHYHAVFFGLSDALALHYVKKAWTYGFSQVGALQPGGLRYVLKYMTKSRADREIEQFYKANGIQKPFIKHSEKLGFDWIYNNRNAIVENRFCWIIHGHKALLPKYVRNVVERLTGVDPRPYVLEYINSVDTRGLSFDDFTAKQTYERERLLEAKMRQEQQAYTFPRQYRKPKHLRYFDDDTNFNDWFI